MDMVSVTLARDSIRVVVGSRENPLPAPFFTGIRVFAIQCIGQNNSSQASREIILVLALYEFQMFQQGLLNSRGKHRITVLPSLTLPYNDLVSGKINVLDP